MPQHFRPQFSAILFDIDNVLVDTRRSYLAAIQKTVERYLNRPNIISAKEVDRFKLLGGFNDDWDCCYAIITFLETSIQGKPIRFGDHRRQRLSISELTEQFPERPLGVEGLMKRLRVLYERLELPSYEKIAGIFQELYLGKKGNGTGGLIQKEKPIFPKLILEKIHRQGIRFGIVTGRNRFEAEYALKRFGIFKLFDSIVTIDEVKREEKKTGESRRKPHPWPLVQAAKQLTANVPRITYHEKIRGSLAVGRGTFLYVGDLPDDILTAERAKKLINVKSAAFWKFTQDPETTVKELKRVKPDFWIGEPRDLLKIVTPYSLAPAKRR